MKYKILYRGTLSSCNYCCSYCPFAKSKESRASLARDQAALERFVNWVRGQTGDRVSIFFTPWGEALVRRWYREAMIDLSRMAHVEKVAIQTNLSGNLDWLAHCNPQRVALWTTFHPTQVRRARFVAQCHELDRQGIRYSVGMVGLKEYQQEIACLRRELEPQIYLWINAYKDQPNYYTPADIDEFNAIDPLFGYNLTQHHSQGQRCQAGETAVAIAGDGNIRRCHFIKAPIGHIYTGDIKAALKPRPCPNSYCDCHIGYVHLNHLGLYEVFGDGVLERIPTVPVGKGMASF